MRHERATPANNYDPIVTEVVGSGPFQQLVRATATKSPASGPYLTYASSVSLKNARVLTGTATVAVDLATAGQAKVSVPDGSITDAKLRNSAATSVIGRSAGSTGAPADISAGSDGQVLRRSGGTLGFGDIPQSSVTGLVAALAGKDVLGAAWTALLGDGSDGAATLDGTATVAWASKSGSVYTMTRDAWLTSLSVSTGVTLNLAGFLPYVRGTVTNAGTIQAIGNAGSGVTGGAAVSAVGSWGTNAGAGGNGASGTASGNNGAGSGGNSLGGGGGAGGNADGTRIGGTGNTSASPGAALGSIRELGVFMRRRFIGGNAINGSGGGGGGGAVAGAGTATGGGGGSGAPLAAIFCLTYNGTGGVLQSKGGDGAAGAVTVDGKAGGGGGGSGGPVLLACFQQTAAGTVQSVGGTGGAGAGGGVKGNDGTPGTVVSLVGF